MTLRKIEMEPYAFLLFFMIIGMSTIIVTNFKSVPTLLVSQNYL